VIFQPDPTVYEEPSYLNPNKDFLWPIAYEGGQTGELERGMTEWKQRLQNTRDTIAARDAARRGDLTTAQQIMELNPNVGIQATGPGGRVTLWGKEAAGFLTGLFEITGGWGEYQIEQQSAQAGTGQQQTAHAKGFPCPPTIRQMIHNKQIRRIMSDLFKRSGHRTDNPIEHGGWLYQDRKGRLHFREADASRRGSGSLNVANPPTVKGARLIAIVHTHPYTANIQNYALNNEVWNDPYMGPYQNTGPSWRDHDYAVEHGVPNLVIYEARTPDGNGSARWLGGVGPERMGFNPERAGEPSDGYPGNSVNTKNCK
jgi:hypothetical protein